MKKSIGRPKLPQGEKKVSVSVKLHPITVAMLDSMGKSRADTITKLVQNAKS